MKPLKDEDQTSEMNEDLHISQNMKLRFKPKRPSSGGSNVTL
jgi:hypothetical protein